MAKKRKPKHPCKHGNSSVYMTGCPHCVYTAMGALHICQDNDLTHVELFALLHGEFNTHEKWESAKTRARALAQQWQEEESYAGKISQNIV